MIRGSSELWLHYRFADTVRLQDVYTVNSRLGYVFKYKWLNYVVMKKDGLNQPKTALINP